MVNNAETERVGERSFMLNERGFTLIELLVVILIVGILVAVTIPIMQGYIVQAKMTELYTTVAAIE